MPGVSIFPRIFFLKIVETRITKYILQTLRYLIKYQVFHSDKFFRNLVLKLRKLNRNYEGNKFLQIILIILFNIFIKQEDYSLQWGARYGRFLKITKWEKYLFKTKLRTINLRPKAFARIPGSESLGLRPVKISISILSNFCSISNRFLSKISSKVTNKPNIALGLFAQGLALVINWCSQFTIFLS